MTNPIHEEGDLKYLVLVNDEGQHSLWPDLLDVPLGWNRVFGPEKRELCLKYVKENWTDMRPKSLIKQMESQSNSNAA